MMKVKFSMRRKRKLLEVVADLQMPLKVNYNL